MRKFKLKKDLPGIPVGTILVEEVAFPGTSDLFIDGYTKERTGLTLREAEEVGETLSIGGVHHATATVGEWLEEIEPEYKRWRAEAEETYFYVDNDAKVLSSFEADYQVDDDRYRLGNYFQTKEEARAYADYLKALAVVRDDAKGFKPNWSDSDQKKYYVCYVPLSSEIMVGEKTITISQGVFELPYFATKEDTEASIEKHEKAWKTIFGIKD